MTAPSLRGQEKIDDRTERAQRAVAAFRKMQFGLASYARAITGDPKVRIEVSNGPPRTDGKVIYYRPPIALGDKTPHDRYSCDKRGEDGLHLCPACRVREEVLVNIYHEISHIAFGTFADENFLERSARQSKFLPHIYNCLEDTRVDSNMFEARKGTRKMMEADTYNMMRQGMSDQQPINSQAVLALYMSTVGFEKWRDFFHPQIVSDVEDPEVQYRLRYVRMSKTAAEIYEATLPVFSRMQELGYFLDERPESQPQPEEPDEQQDPQDSNPGDQSDSTESDSSDESEQQPDAGGDASEGDDGSESNDDSGEGSESSDPEVGSDSSGDSGGRNQSPGEADEQAAGEDSPGEAEHDSASADDAVGEGQSSGDEAEGDAERREGGESPSDQGDENGRSAPEGDEVDADSDGVPEESSSSGESHDGDSDGDADVSGSDAGSADQIDGAADSTDNNVPGGGAEAKRSDDGSNDPQGAEDQSESDCSGSSDAGSLAEEDGQWGAGLPGEDQAAGEASERSDDVTEGSSDRSVGDQPESDGNDDRPDRSGELGADDLLDDDEPFDSGADEGKGGIPVESLAYGDEEDVESAVQQHAQLVHPEPDSKIDQKAIDVAVIQGEYFETPSVNVDIVLEFNYGPDEPGWSGTKWSPSTQRKRGVLCDLDISESVLGPSMLRLRRVFSDNQNSDYQPNLRSGRVNQRVLGRRAWSGDDRLFGKKRVPARKDYAVLIVLDISSSNLGKNLALLKRSVFAQAEMCARVGVKFAVVAHSATGIRLDDENNIALSMNIHHIKGWDEPWDSATKVRMEHLTALGGNLDGHAMEFARKMLGKVVATDKVMLYYTDGKMPAANHDEELEVLQHQIKLCKRDRITLLGVGIRTDSPTRHGLDTVAVYGDDDLKAVVDHLGKRLASPVR